MDIIGIKTRIERLDLDVILFLDKAEYYQERAANTNRPTNPRELDARMMERCLTIAIHCDEELQVLKHELKQIECNHEWYSSTPQVDMSYRCIKCGMQET